MQSARAVVEVLRARGRRGLPCERLYRQLFNTELFLLAWGRIYANDGAMTPGINGETADGMSPACRRSASMCCPSTTPTVSSWSSPRRQSRGR
jgi:hypothetical protein